MTEEIKTTEEVVETVKVKTSKKGRKPKNVEAVEIVQENVEAVEDIKENVEPTLNEVPLEFVENTQENVEAEETEGDKEAVQEASPVMDAIKEIVEDVKKVLKKKPDNFDIIKWRRLGRR